MAYQDGVLAAALLVTAVLNWWSVARGEYSLERITKPLFILLLAGLAWSLAGSGAPPDAADLAPVLAALALSLVGDIALLTATATRFLLGLGAFLLSHVAWIWAVLTSGGPEGFPWLLLLALPLPVLAHGRFGRDVVRHAGEQRGAVLVYELVLVLLLWVAAAKGDWVVTLGAAVFLLSDLMLAHDRFVQERRAAPVQVMATYHAAQVLLVVGLLR